MRSRRKALWLLVPVLAVSGLGSAWGYRLFGSYWANARTEMYSGIPGFAPSGKPWAEAYRDAMAVWNEKTVFQFYPNAEYRDPCAGYNGRGSSGALNGQGDLYNGAAFRADVCGSPFDSSALAVTFNRGLVNSFGNMHMLESDIIFNARHSWDIYDGPPRSVIDFRRVALHELGHVIGLDHEPVGPAIMQPQVSTLSDLTQDDVAGVNAIYAPGGGRTCRIEPIGTEALVGEELTAVDDCRMRELFGGRDESFVDIYRVDITQQQRLYMHAEATGFDPVIIALSPGLEVMGIFESDGCQVSGVTSPLPPGSYYMLVNTYDVPTDCGAGEGHYTFSVSGSPVPVLGAARNFATLDVPDGILFQAGATADGGVTYRTQFAAAESIDVNARVKFHPDHVGQEGAIYVVAILDDGRSFMKTMDGRFVPFSGRQTDLQPVFRLPLGSQTQDFDVVEGLRGDLTGLAGRDFHVFIGYSVASQPGVVYYPRAPLSFRINAP